MRLVLFDFDGTLTRRDSYLPFLRYTFGTMRFLTGLLATGGPLLAYAAGRITNDQAKTKVMKRFLSGLPIEDVNRMGEKYANEKLPMLLRPSTMNCLKKHLAAGDTCVLVSASLDVYLRPWAVANGFEDVLCTSLAVNNNQCITGELFPANCYGPEKVRRVVQWLNGRNPKFITAYGDSAGDKEMLDFSNKSFYVTNHGISIKK